MVPRAPPEIIDAVVDELATDKKDLASFTALLRCSMVSKQVYWRCRTHLFQEINLGWSKRALATQDSQGLTSGTVSGLVNILLHNPLLSNSIQSLRINPIFYYSNTDRDNLCDNLSILLERLPHLRTFALTSGSDPDAASLPWNWFPLVVQSAIEACCARPTIKRVEFRGFEGFPTNLIYTCSPSLTTLYLSRTFNPTGVELAENALEHFKNSGESQRPRWSLQSLVCQNALPLLRSAIHHEFNPEHSPFSGLQHLNVAILTHNDSSLIAPLLRQSMLSMRRLEVSFSLWTGESTFDTDWVHLPHLQRLHVAIGCTQIQNGVHFPPEVPNLIYDVVHDQTSVVNLSFHATCQMTFVPHTGSEEFIFAHDGDAWKRLGDRLASESFANLSTLRVSLSLILVQADGEVEISREMCEKLENGLAEEVEKRFDVPGRTLSHEISVQSLRELFPAIEGWQ